ncbi:MAG: phage baseplate assembly protein V [Xanthobacteraceae bacterium]
MTSIVETIQKIVRSELRSVGIAELGVVDAVSAHKDAGDNDNYGCDVRLKNTGLLLKRVPITTGHIGSAAIPNVGDLVLLTFAKGDMNQPIVVGRLYTDDDRPPVNTDNELIMHLPLHADDDKAIKTAIRNISDKNPPREILAEMAPKISVRITDGTVHATAGKSEMKLDQPDGGGGTVTVLAGGTKITMNEDGDVIVEAVGDLTLRANGAMKLQAGTDLTMKAGTNAQLTAGASLSLQGTAEAKLEASGSLSVRGAVVSVAGITSFSPG